MRTALRLGNTCEESAAHAKFAESIARLDWHYGVKLPTTREIATVTRELHLADETIDGVLIIHVGGHIDGVNAREFQSGLDHRIQNTDGPAILDFEKLTYISSAGLHSILLIAKIFRDKNKKFMLCSLPAPALQVIRTSGFDKIIDIRESLSEAMAAASH